MKGLARFLIIVGLGFLVAPAVSAQTACSTRDLSHIGEQNTYVDTVEKKVTIDSVTNQKVITFRLRVTSYTPGPTSSKRICITKEPGVAREALRPPQPLPPVTTEAPLPPPPATVNIMPPQNNPIPSRPGRSCWRTGLCELGLAGLAAGGTILGVQCARFWCNPRQHQDIGVVVVTSSTDRRRQYGVGLSMPFLRP